MGAQNLIRFRIPTLDKLFGTPTGMDIPRRADARHVRTTDGGATSSPDALAANAPPEQARPTVAPGGPLTTSVCIAGPTGTGKSLLALHLASAYRADNPDEWPKIIYLSTDFSHAKAHQVWDRFCLGCPDERSDPFAEQSDSRSRHLTAPDAVPLLHCPAETLAYSKTAPVYTEVVDYLWSDEGDHNAAVLFVDLNSSRNGDEWDFVNRLLAILRPTGSDLAHLVIIDAVEGLDMFAGSRDSHGERRTRRSRVTQLLRTAGGKAHLVFVVEDEGVRDVSPEEFLTDFLVRLRHTQAHGYDRRTVEVVKARAQAPWRGQHRYVIRDGAAPKDRFPDDPAYEHGYVHVFHSLHSRTREQMRLPARKPAHYSEPFEESRAAFGIEFLDELLGPASPPDPELQPHAEPREYCGLPLGKVTGLIGEDGTHKSRLGRAFLSGCFDQDQLQGVGVLLTLTFIDRNALARLLLMHRTAHVGALTAEDVQAVSDRIVYRQLEIHDLTSPVLIHIVSCAIQKAKEILKSKELWSLQGKETRSLPYSEDSRRIRIVIDDWSTISAAYPDIANDPLLLPFLIDLLQRENVTCLLIDTQTGSPRAIIAEERDRELRSLVSHQIYTWHVPFFGEERIAITALPSITDSQRTSVRELRHSDRQDDETLWVDPHFEVYSGLERSDPRAVPLQLRLYAKTAMFEEYLDTLSGLFKEPFRPLPNQPLVIHDRSDEYERLRHFSHVQSDTRLDYTLVFDVDEFWMQPHGRTELLALDDYLLVTTDLQPGAAADDWPQSSPRTDVNDPFHYFRGPIDPRNRHFGTGARRYQYFRRRGYNLENYIERAGRKDGPRLDRVPFMWDFGFILLDSIAWNQAAPATITGAGTVGNVLTRLQSDSLGRVSWRAFLEACCVVAQVASAKGKSHRIAFDVDARATEAFSCWLLEVWFSEIWRTESNRIKLQCYTNRSPRVEGAAQGRRCSLISLLDEFCAELFRAWLLLEGAIVPSLFLDDENRATPRAARVDAIAARHWYSTATICCREDEHGRWRPCRLPGHFTTRGDWYLAIAKGSRSERLGWHAIDLLSSQQENIRRLHLGLGLPTRDYLPIVGEERDASEELLSALSWVADGRHRQMTYGEIIADLGAKDNVNQKGPEGFHWLFRSTIRRYGTNSRVWGMWLARILAAWHDQRAKDPPKSGFEQYELLANAADRGGLEELPSWVWFKRECEYATAGLRASWFSP